MQTSPGRADYIEGQAVFGESTQSKFVAAVSYTRRVILCCVLGVCPSIIQGLRNSKPKVADRWLSVWYTKEKVLVVLGTIETSICSVDNMHRRL
jgi:hypothetical protein